MMEDTVKVSNLKQAAFYIKEGNQPVKVELAHNGRLRFIFSLEETQAAYLKWMQQCMGEDYHDYF